MGFASLYPSYVFREALARAADPRPQFTDTPNPRIRIARRAEGPGAAVLALALADLDAALLERSDAAATRVLAQLVPGWSGDPEAVRSVAPDVAVVGMPG
ncbi:MAG: hypothetical protein KFB96_23320 [Thiocapsa sp.]|uniref:hypothetical protein n=1 Tax=Thiocapsa sp. TaxID=2024551 RepID=UPI001BCD3595|nr:hypothetical protein [Thiocapsa sp.]QVL48489.1 MAG: hypothetical protein KFB96_23320 [Thiocapsa sp.]